ncbi:transcriptional regulator/antitoxin, MazE [Verrucomicrobia bacterium LW23]|nr:transcriptional regulator/antitoxin, MazE [Verrucomicrobia bacterium LW23]
MTTVLSKHGRITLPPSIRERMELRPGQIFEVLVDDEDTILLRRTVQRPNHGLVDHLLTVPFHFSVPLRANDCSHPLDL